MDKDIKELEIDIIIARNEKKKAIVDLWTAQDIIKRSNQIIWECRQDIRTLKGEEN